MHENPVKMLKSPVAVFVLMTLCVICDSELLIDGQLERQSIFYGLALTASLDAADSECTRQLVVVEEGIRNKETWALKLLDASGHPETAFYWGNNYWLGSEVQCSLSDSLAKPNISPHDPPHIEDSPQTIANFPVSYYAAYFYHNSTFQIFTHWDNETKMTLGLCLPSSCEGEEIRSLLQEYFDSGVLSYQQLYNASFTLDNVHKIRSDYTWMTHPMAIIFIFCTCVLAVLIFFGTFYDVLIYQPALEKCMRQSNAGALKEECTASYAIEGISRGKNKPDVSKFHEVILSFSWYTNFSQLFTLQTGPNVLMPILGFRVVSAAFVIISHSNLLVRDYYTNRALAYFLSDSLIGQIMSNTPYSVDVFFLLGGFLMANSLRKSKDLIDEANHTAARLTELYLKTLFKRFRRLTPVYIYILGLTFITAASNRTSVAKWTNERNDLQCPKYWWTNMLYINNIFPGTSSEMCMSWSYYLSNDMQFYAWAAFLFHLSKIYYKTSVTLLIGTFVGSSAARGIVTYVGDYKPYLVTFYLKAPLVFYPPWMRIGPYIVGACYGYIYSSHNGKLEIKKVTVWLLWIASLAILGYLFMGLSDKDFPTYFSVLFAMLSRNLFAVATGWIILACLTGHGGAANTLLSAKGLLPFGHLAYTASLLNPVIIYLLMSNSDHAMQIGINSVLLNGFGLMGLTFFCSMFLAISVEYPFDKVLKIFFDQKQRKKLPQTKKDLRQETLEVTEENTKL